MLNKRELENEIIRLRQEGKTYREISKILHVSPSQISAALKKSEGTNNEPSIQTKAYEMFLKGKRPIDVAIALGIGDEQTTKLWKEYLHLSREYKLLKIRDELKDNFDHFVNLFKEMMSKYYTLDEMREALGIIGKTGDRLLSLSIIEREKEQCQEEVDRLSRELGKVRSKISVANQELESLESIKRSLLVTIKSLAQERIYVETQLNQLYDSSYIINSQFASNSFSISGKKALT